MKIRCYSCLIIFECYKLSIFCMLDNFSPVIRGQSLLLNTTYKKHSVPISLST